MPIPEFIKSLRSKIGKELLQVPASIVFVYDDKRHLLPQAGHPEKTTRHINGLSDEG